MGWVKVSSITILQFAIYKANSVFERLVCVDGVTNYYSKQKIGRFAYQWPNNVKM